MSVEIRPTLRPSEFREDEIQIEHNGTAWLVTSYFDSRQQSETRAEAMANANGLRDGEPGDKPKVILHRAASPCAK
jgi:hypothetical protein